MIEMIAGVCGLPITDKHGKKIRIKGMGPNDGPFSISPQREAELVSLGLARYVEQQPDEDVGVPIGFDEMPPEDYIEGDEDLSELPDGVTGIPAYSVEMKATELREIGKLCGLAFKVGMSKQDMVDALDAHIAANMVEGVEVDEDGEIVIDEDEPAPTFDAAEAVL